MTKEEFLQKDREMRRLAIELEAAYNNKNKDSFPIDRVKEMKINDIRRIPKQEEFEVIINDLLDWGYLGLRPDTNPPLHKIFLNKKDRKTHLSFKVKHLLDNYDFYKKKLDLTEAILKYIESLPDIDILL